MVYKTKKNPDKLASKLKIALQKTLLKEIIKKVKVVIWTYKPKTGRKYLKIIIISDKEFLSRCSLKITSQISIIRKQILLFYNTIIKGAKRFQQTFHQKRYRDSK